jgi:hypothetical protein
MVFGIKIGSDWDVLFDLCGWISYPFTAIIELHEVFSISEAVTDLRKGIAVIVEAEGKKNSLAGR